MNILSFSFLDWIPLFLYLIFLIYIGIRSTTNRRDEENFILSGRRLTLPAFVATLVSTWYGGILGVGEFSYLYGISNWIAFGLPYYIFAVLFAFVFVPKLKKEQLITLPEIFLVKYNRNTSVIAAFFVYLVTNPAPYILMAAVLLQLFFPVPLWVALVLIIVFSSFYLFKGGFGAVVKTDILQFVVMFLGFILIIPFAYTQLGNLSSMMARLPEQHLTITGGNSWFYIMVWYFVAMITLVDPNFYQRCFAAKNTKTAQKGILTAVGFWLIFDLMTTLVGLYARAYVSLEQPYYAYPALADMILPPLFKGLFITSLFATIMSSLDSFTFSASISLSRDILSRIFSQNSFSRFYGFSLIFTLALSFVIALFLPSVIRIWYFIANISIPPLLFPVIIFYWGRYRPDKKIIYSAMITSFVLAFLDFILAASSGMSGSWLFPGLDPIYIGMAINIFLYSGDWIHQKMKSG